MHSAYTVQKMYTFDQHTNDITENKNGPVTILINYNFRWPISFHILKVAG